jgi:hypothetical protein
MVFLVYVLFPGVLVGRGMDGILSLCVLPKRLSAGVIVSHLVLGLPARSFFLWRACVVSVARHVTQLITSCSLTILHSPSSYALDVMSGDSMDVEVSQIGFTHGSSRCK